ncbi:MAG: regulatory protein RecX [Alphaproteobacteria bacterium]|nr:regulatory protein RecX [Alphaproteobacteria bacterium]
MPPGFTFICFTSSLRYACPAMKPQKIKKIKLLTKDRLEFLALRYVTRYSATRGMLARVLQRHIDKATYNDKEFATRDALQWKETILNKFEEKNWINDADLAKRFIEHGKQAGLSRQKMQQKLTHKGVGKELIKETFYEVVEDQTLDEMDLASARIYAKKKSLGLYRKSKDADPKKELAKMCRAGFSFDIAMKALKVKMEEED